MYGVSTYSWPSSVDSWQLLGQQPDTSLEADLELDSLDAALVGLFLEVVGVDLGVITVDSFVTLGDLYGTVVVAHADGRFSPGQARVYPGEYVTSQV